MQRQTPPQHARTWRWGLALLWAASLVLLLGSYGCSECRYDVDCQGIGLCQSGRCVGQQNQEKPPLPSLDGGPSPNRCLEGEIRDCYSGAPQTRKVGSCKDGKQTCTGGVWSICAADTKPAQELCNNLDDDCNGQIDDGPFGGQPCLVPGQKGPCERGVQKCAQGQLVCTQTTQPAQETCGNGEDENCNGQVDEPPHCTCTAGNTQPCYTGPSESRGKGTCADGTQVCGTDQTWGKCSGDTKPAQETCDGKDNDCDGEIDEAITQPCGSTKGTCLAGTQACENGQWSATCVGEVKPVPETCDGKDNNCDGSVDEGLSQPCSTPCGAGTRQCQGGQWQACESPNVGKEVCDNKDNDCDGKTDETLTQSCTNGCGKGIETCDRGQWINCSAPKSSPEVCDGKDNDCDGQVDETRGPSMQLTQDLTTYHYGLAAASDGKATGVLYRIDKIVYFQLFDLAGKSLGKATAADVAGSASPYNLQLLWTGKEYTAYWRFSSTGKYQYKFARFSATGKKLSLTGHIHSNSARRIAWNGLNYGITWSEYSSATPRGYQIRFERLTPTGTVLGPIVDVSTFHSSYVSGVQIANVGNTFGIAWQQTRTSGNSEIYFQKIDKDAKKVGSEINVSNAAGSSYAPALTAAGNNFFVAYRDNRSSTYQIYGARLSSTSIQGAITTRTITTGGKSITTILVAPLNRNSSTAGYGVLWLDNDANNKRQLWFQKTSFSGLPKGTPFQVSKTTTFTYTPALVIPTTTVYGAFWMDSRTGRTQLWYRSLCGL